jgi:hypothetical protein
MMFEDDPAVDVLKCVALATKVIAVFWYKILLFGIQLA